MSEEMGKRELRSVWRFDLSLTLPHGHIDATYDPISYRQFWSRSYFYRFRLNYSPICPKCPEEDETVEHFVFSCPQFSDPRIELESSLGEQLRTVIIIKVVLKSEQNWSLVNVHPYTMHCEWWKFPENCQPRRIANWRQAKKQNHLEKLTNPRRSTIWLSSGVCA